MPTCPKCQAQMEKGFIVDEWHRLFRAVSRLRILRIRRGFGS
jgi:hypothetical protein